MRSRAARSSTPSPSTGTMSASGTARCTLSCSMDEISTRRRPAPASAMLLASVPPEVKITSAGRAPTRAATWRRALSTRPRALRPTPCTADGLPPVANAATMASNASGRSGLVALWSRYTDAAGIELAFSWRRPSRNRCWPRRGASAMRDTRRRSSTSSRVTELRKVWIWLPSSSHRSCVRHLLRSARQPVAPISVQRVALIGSSTARMISETRVSAEPRARR